VLVADAPLSHIGAADIAMLKERAAKNPRQRMRICAHRSSDDRLHEMLIVLTGKTYIRPHKHLNKSESFHLIEGEADAIFFDDAGKVTETIKLGPGRQFFYRIEEPRFHTLLIRSDFLVFHETTNGPFNRADTLFAPWSPEETDLAGAQRFMESLRRA
jgi:cupin fold WbuC family metalloprotein